MIFKTTISSTVQKREAKSRRDNTLLTVGFNLRKTERSTPHQVPQGRHYGSTVPAGLWSREDSLSRRLRYALPTVNKVLSLRDNSPLKQHSYKLFIFHY